MNDITTEELKERIEKNEALNLVDVREDYENEEFNIGGTHIPLGSLPDRFEELSDRKDEEMIVYCRSGNRSGQAKMFLTEMGFTKVRNLTGGMLRWQELNK